MDTLEKIHFLLLEKFWSGSIKTKWNPPEGLFLQDAETIAKTLADSSTDLKQAMSRLNFYMNRAGKNIKPSRRKILNKAKDLLRKKYETK